MQRVLAVLAVLTASASALAEARRSAASAEWQPRTLIEPFRIKMVEPMFVTTRAERAGYLAAAQYNLFKIDAGRVLLDFLTDSGTGAMSGAQWAAMIDADEAYAGALSWRKLESSFKRLFDFKHLLPTHQGRAAERLLFAEIGGEGKRFLANTFFDTTRANAEATGATCIDLPFTQADRDAGFGGNIDLERLERELRGSTISGVVITATNNAGGGQPVSLANMRAAAELCRAAGVPLILDGCRFAENAHFIRAREPGMSGHSIREIVGLMSPLFGVMTMSAKKDGLANTGGWLALRDDALAERLKQRLILTEGYLTYGGMAGRDMAAIAVGLDEVVDPHYLDYRTRTVAYMSERLLRAGVPILTPPGGHAVYLDASAMLPDVPPSEFPGQAIACALYLEGGLRSCEIGSLMFGAKATEAGKRELVRLAFPRRMYTQAHFDLAIEMVVRVHELCQAGKITGMRITRGADSPLRHFSAALEPLPRASGPGKAIAAPVRGRFNSRRLAVPNVNEAGAVPRVDS
jgi:tryptophanase